MTKITPTSPGILVGDMAYVLPTAVVRTWEVHGLRFTPGLGANRRRATQVRQGVLHWTGGEGGPEQVYGTLLKRGLGIHFVVAGDGEIWQTADPLTCATAHAGHVNQWSWGVEIVCSGLAPLSPVPLWKGRDRERYSATIHGAKHNLVDFRPAQYAALLELVDAMSLAIPTVARVVPAGTDGVPYTGVFAPSELAKYSGLVCHSNVSSQKIDAGPRVLSALQAHFLKDTLVPRPRNAPVS